MFNIEDDGPAPCCGWVWAGSSLPAVGSGVLPPEIFFEILYAKRAFWGIFVR